MGDNSTTFRPPKRMFDDDKKSSHKHLPAMSTQFSMNRQTELTNRSEVFELHQQVLQWVEKYERAVQAVRASEARANFLENLIVKNRSTVDEKVNELERRVNYLTNELEKERRQSKKRIEELTSTVTQQERFLQQSQQNCTVKGRGPKLISQQDPDIIAIDELVPSPEVELLKKMRDLEFKYQRVVREMEKTREKTKFLENLIETSSAHSDRISATVSIDESENRDFARFRNFYTIVHEKYNKEYRTLEESAEQEVAIARKRMREEEPAAYADARECAKAWTSFYSKHRGQIPEEYVTANREAFVKRWTSKKRSAEETIELNDDYVVWLPERLPSSSAIPLESSRRNMLRPSESRCTLFSSTSIDRSIGRRPSSCSLVPATRTIPGGTATRSRASVTPSFLLPSQLRLVPLAIATGWPNSSRRPELVGWRSRRCAHSSTTTARNGCEASQDRPSPDSTRSQMRLWDNCTLVNI